MPPTAPITGSADCRMDDRCPSRISRLTSRPTSRKKMVIKPSLIQWCRVLSSLSAPTRISIGMCRNVSYKPEITVLLNSSASTVAIINSMPLDDSFSIKSSSSFFMRLPNRWFGLSGLGSYKDGIAARLHRSRQLCHDRKINSFVQIHKQIRYFCALAEAPGAQSFFVRFIGIVTVHKFGMR